MIAALGRLPNLAGFAGTEAVRDRFGSLKRALAAIRRITDEETWEAISRRATGGFAGLPGPGPLPQTAEDFATALRLTARQAFFAAYSRACEEVDAGLALDCDVN